MTKTPTLRPHKDGFMYTFEGWTYEEVMEYMQRIVDFNDGKLPTKSVLIFNGKEYPLEAVNS